MQKAAELGKEHGAYFVLTNNSNHYGVCAFIP
jgi:LDH2 family malate/lactate/ureidoglycolate dehydrogenase